MAPSTLGLCRLSALTAAASAFRSASPPVATTATTARADAVAASTALHAAHHNHYCPPFPFPDPYYHPHGHFNNNPQSHPYQQQRHTPWPPRRSVALDAEVVAQADEMFDGPHHEEEEEAWIADRELSRMAAAAAAERRGAAAREGRGEVIDFDPEPPRGRGPPLKSAAAPPSSRNAREGGGGYGGREPGGRGSRAPPVDDPRGQHVLLDDDHDEFAGDFFRQRWANGAPHPPQPPPPPQRPGPSVYTPEEEDLIASMGGRGGGHRTTQEFRGGGPRSTQEFAGLGTMTKKGRQGAGGGGGAFDPDPRGEMPVDPQRRNYNPEQDYVPPPPMPPGQPFAERPRGDSPEQDYDPGRFVPPPPMPPVQPFADGRPNQRQEGYLGDSTLREISLDYSVPIPYLADVLATWGAPVPIDPNSRLGDLATGEQAFAVLEAIHTLDVAGLHERYSEDNLMNICDYYDIDLKGAFDYCVDQRGWALPFGVRTFLRVEQEEELLDALSREEVY